jgi:hypothetical protein
MPRSSPSRRTRTALLCLLLLGGCAVSQEQPPLDAGAGPSDAMGAALDGCPARPSTVSAAPTTISDAVALANGLLGSNSSLSIDCFLATLSRPLTVVGAVSTFSLQPSPDGARDPRLFIFSGNLMLSAVPSGMGSWFIELAETTTPLRSLKAQLGPFPLTEAIPAAKPYDDIRQPSGGTICGTCHSGEEIAPQITATTAFDSAVFRPFSTDLVPLDQMQNETASCDPQQEPQRCAILNAVFGHGTVVTGAFPPDAQTF